MPATSKHLCAPVHGLPQQLGDYVVQQFLGEGAFGKVAKCLNSKTGEVVALKIFENGTLEDVERELGILLHLHHTTEPGKANIIKYIDHFAWKDYKCIAYEVLDRSLLDFSMQRGRPFSLSEIRPMAQQLLVAFEALKDAQVLHSDLKPDNIMLVNQEEQPFKVKLIDFGCGGFFSELDQGMVFMTDGYREGFLGYPLFSHVSHYDNLRTIIHLLGQPSDEMLNKSFYADKFFLQMSSNWTFKTPLQYEITNYNLSEEAYLDLKAFTDLVKNLLQPDPDKRLTVSEALRHPFLTMEHLTNGNSEYAREAIKLMSVTQTSAPGDGVQNQHSKLSVAIEKPGVSFVFGDQQLPPDNERFPVDEDGDVIMEAVEVSDEKDIGDHFDQRPEEQLHFSPNISHRMETHEQTAASGHVIIDLPDYSADDANEPDTAAKSERSSSFWSAVRNFAFGGLVAVQATTCYALTGSALVAGVVTLPMLVYGGIDYILTNMETTASSSSKGC
ncbi:hypothetical protein WMY93_029079 [Mugilogobius chulae]|uniref:Protein kinase domain-containing protein n=1 Tax=Mugilogobius chulae TaxID=88201 RepID=A0AAW0MR81_9GOBI